MLGKLLKYDFKAQYKVHCGIYLLILISAVANFGLLKLKDKYPKAEILNIIMPFAIAFFVILIVAVIFVTFVLSLLRYRNNLLKDEGYLMHTLPIPFWMLYFSKMFVSVCWYVADAVVAAAAISIVTGGFEWFKVIEVASLAFFGTIHEETLMTGELSTAGVAAGVKAASLLGFAVFMLIGLISGISNIYMCLSLGYTSYSNKDLMSFVAYIITYMITQILSFVGMIIVGIADFGSMNAMFGDYAVMERIDPGNYMKHVMMFAMALSVLMTVVYNWLAIRTMNSKLNLE